MKFTKVMTIIATMIVSLNVFGTAKKKAHYGDPNSLKNYWGTATPAHDCHNKSSADLRNNTNQPKERKEIIAGNNHNR